MLSSRFKHPLLYIVKQLQQSLLLRSKMRFTPPLGLATAAFFLSPAFSAPGHSEHGELHYPPESQRHTRILLSYPITKSVYGPFLPTAQRELCNIAQNVAQFESVTLYVDPTANVTCAPHKNITIQRQAVEDVWIRDFGPIFVHGPNGGLKGVDFNHNGWGKTPPIYDLPESHTKFAARALKTMELQRVKAKIVSEGGAIEVSHDGKILLTTESAVVNDNRNPGMSRDQIETEFKRVLGVEEVIWIKGVKGVDITDGHIDALARFGPDGKTILVSRPPQEDGEWAVWWKIYEDIVAMAKARGWEVVDLVEPRDLGDTYAHEMTEAYGRKPVLAYVNYLLVNGGVIIPKFGAKEEDEAAKRAVEKVWAGTGRKVVQVPLRILPRAGGGIHCSTQQMPKVEGDGAGYEGPEVN